MKQPITKQGFPENNTIFYRAVEAIISILVQGLGKIFIFSLKFTKNHATFFIYNAFLLTG